MTRSVRLGNGSSAQNGRLHLLPRGNPSCPQLLLVPGATMFQGPQIIRIWGTLSASFVLETPTHGVGAARRIKVTPAGLWETQQPGGRTAPAELPCSRRTPAPGLSFPIRDRQHLAPASPAGGGEEQGQSPSPTPSLRAGGVLAKGAGRRVRAPREGAAGSGAPCRPRRAARRPRPEQAGEGGPRCAQPYVTAENGYESPLLGAKGRPGRVRRRGHRNPGQWWEMRGMWA